MHEAVCAPEGRGYVLLREDAARSKEAHGKAVVQGWMDCRARANGAHSRWSCVASVDVATGRPIDALQVCTQSCDIARRAPELLVQFRVVGKACPCVALSNNTEHAFRGCVTGCA